jgi:Zn-dependent peptidase ImmA (M78 family)
MKNLLGSRLKLARVRAMLSQRALAKKVGVSAQAISKYERGLDVPSSRVLLRLARALGVKVAFFFRETSISSIVPAYRKKACLKRKEEQAIIAQIQDWLESYLAIEDLYSLEERAHLPVYDIASMEAIEKAAIHLREQWALGLAPIENLMELLEDKGIKVGLIEGYEGFDGCTFLVNEKIPIIVVRKDLAGDRQRFSLAHELGHLVLNVADNLDKEKAAHRFAGAFLVPEEVVYYELGNKRKSLNLFELHLLKHKYGLSMQGWIYRAKDLKIISEASARQLFTLFHKKGWHKEEPGDQIPPEKPKRMERLILRALEEGIISRAKASELLGKDIFAYYQEEAKEHGGFPAGICH